MLPEHQRGGLFDFPLIDYRMPALNGVDQGTH
jgi:hypothetical protein